MKQITGFKMRKLGSEHIILPEGSNTVNFNKMVSFNDSAAYLWESVEGREFSVDDLAKLLEDKYEIDHGTAVSDSKKIAEQWLKSGLVAE